MKILQPYLYLFSCALIVVAAACSEQKPDAKRADSTADAEAGQPNGNEEGKEGVVRLPTETPTGRVQLPTVRTAAPDLWVTLPDGFTVRADTTLEYDLLVVSRTDDPLLSDSTQVPFGMLRIVVGDTTIRVTPPGVQVAERNGMIGDYPGRWRYYTAVIPGGATYYSHELIADDYFARISPERDMKNLRLHMYIAGKDTSVIRQLIAVSESVSTKP